MLTKTQLEELEVRIKAVLKEVTQTEFSSIENNMADLSRKMSIMKKGINTKADLSEGEKEHTHSASMMWASVEIAQSGSLLKLFRDTSDSTFRVSIVVHLRFMCDACGPLANESYELFAVIYDDETIAYGVGRVLDEIIRR